MISKDNNNTNNQDNRNKKRDPKAGAERLDKELDSYWNKTLKPEERKEKSN